MKQRLGFFLLTLLIFAMSSCGSSEPREVIINNQFKMDIPAYMSPTNNLNEEASLQYQSTFKDIYLIVLEDGIQEFHNSLVEAELEDKYTLDLDGFFNLIIDTSPLVDDLDDLENLARGDINGLDALVFDITTVVDGIDVFYKYGFIEGKDAYYQVVVWTKANKKDDYSDTMDKMIDSFNEL